jgi:hypothetical protein
MVWFWLNVPLAVAFVGAWCGIPLVKVLRNPDWGPGQAGGYRRQLAEPEPADAVACSESRVDAPALAGMPR